MARSSECAGAATSDEEQGPLLRIHPPSRDLCLFEGQEYKDHERRGYIPRWFLSRNILTIFHRQKFLDKPVSLRETAGPGVLCALLNVVLLWTLLPAFVYLTKKTSSCNYHGIASFSWWTFLAFVPVLSACFILELAALRYVLIPKYQILGEFTIFSCLPARFEIWLFFTSMVSVAQYTNFAVNGLFYGEMMSNCGNNAELNSMWDVVLRQSLFQYLLPHALPDLKTVGLVVFLLQFFRLGYALLTTIPRWDELNKLDFELNPAGIESFQYNYKPLLNLNKPLNHGAAIMNLAEVTGMNLILHSDLHYADIKARLALHRLLKPDCKQRPGDWEEMCGHVMHKISRAMLNTFLTGTLVNGSVLNLQVTFLAMHCAIDGTGPMEHGRDLFGIAVNMFTSWIRIYDGFKHADMGIRWWHTFHYQREEILKALGDEKKGIHKEEAYDTEEDMNHYTGWVVFFVLILLFCCAVWLYAFAKLVMVFRCNHALWNITGCASIRLPAV